MMNSKASYVLLIFALLNVVFLLSNATDSPAEMYWKTKVGSIPIPETLKDSLQIGSNDGVVKLNPNYKHNFDNEDPLVYYFSGDELLKDAHPAIDESNFFFWEKHFNKSQVPKDGRVVYFFDNILSRAGAKIKLHFKKLDNEAKFLPLHIAKSMPTTSDKLLEILNLLSVNPKSILAQDIEKAVKTCESKGIKDEIRYCATSLEGMVDYVTSILNSGRTKLMAVSTEQGDGIFMEYTIQKIQKLGSDDNHNMVCHKLSNPYVVFLCHHIKSTNVYGVSLVGANGKQMKAVAMCHKDTSSWNPRHYAFEYLKSKPGGKPICHFVSADAISWFQI